MTVPKFKKFKIEAYKPGKSNIAKIRNIIKLSANESALGMSSKAIKIISNNKLNLYILQTKSKRLHILDTSYLILYTFLFAPCLIFYIF